MGAPRKIYLVGFMGCGKSTVGRILADRIDYPFVDIDEIVEAAAGCSVRQIFEQSGETEFRRREASVLATAVSGLERAVVATGGGTFAPDANRALIQGSGVSVFLEVPFDLLLSRLEEKGASRPLFRDPEQAFRLYSDRLGTYRMADVVLDIRSGQTPEETAERIRLALPWRGRLPGGRR
jgi:shikimate kinase